MKRGSEIKEVFAFKDLSLVPKEVKFKPEEIDLKTRLTKSLSLAIPIISAGHEHVTESKMAIAMASIGGLGVIHGNMPLEKQLQEIQAVKAFDASTITDATKDSQGRLMVGATVGIGKEAFDRTSALSEAGLDIVFVESYYAHNREILETIRLIRQQVSSKVRVVAGNVFTADAARSLIEAGADALKVGSIHNGFKTLGTGIADFTSVSDIVEECSLTNTPVIFDGNIGSADLLAKSIAAGAETVIVSDLFAGAVEAAGADASSQTNVQTIVNTLIYNLKLSISYTGNKNIRTFIDNSEFVRIK